jgi:Helix-turn-helix domain
MTALPQPPPESQLISARRKETALSYRQAARQAGMSPERWRQIEQGMARVARGTDVPVRDAPADTVAKMAWVVGATPAELESCGRADAAAGLRALIAAEPPRDQTTDEMLAELSERLRSIESHLGLRDNGNGKGKGNDQANAS